MSVIKNPLHPGEFLMLGYIEPLGLSITELASNLDVSVSSLSRLVNKKSDLSYDMAVRLSFVLGRSEESWVNLQLRYSLARSRERVDTSLLKKVIFNK